MNVNQILPIIGAMIMIVVVVSKALQEAKPQNWIPPLVLSIVFFLYSAYTIALEGPLGFWSNHTKDFWGNQIWFDLLIGIGTAFIVLIKRFRAQKMNVLPWFTVVIAGGSIGLLLMVARLLYLEQKHQSN